MRTKCSVKQVTVLPFNVSGSGPYKFEDRSAVLVWLVRTYSDGRKERALLTVTFLPCFMTDGASTFWPFSKLVPNWRKGDDSYNAAPAVHDALYILEGVVEGESEAVKLSREEVDDILRGIWRCWGMSRFLAGCADKGVEIFAGGRKHWGNDGYRVRQFVEAKWETLE